MLWYNWQDIMAHFNQCVSDNLYSKMEYKTWRKLSKLEKAEIWYLLSKNRVYVDNPDIAFESYDFSCNDHSLGEFLFTFYPPEMKKEDNMNEKNINNFIKNTEYTCSDNILATYAIAGNAIHTPEPVGISVDRVASQDEVDDIRDNVNELIVQGTEMTDSLNAIWDMIDDIQFKLDCKLDIDHYNNNEKEKNKMKMFGNFEFGKVDGNTVRMSMYGLAVRNQAGTWVSYNPATNEVIDVDVMNFDGSDLMYKMPVALSAVVEGDILIHARKPMIVTGIAEGKFTAVDVIAGEEKIILPTKSPFNFNFVTKVVSLINFSAMGTPNEANPFGNLGLMLALSGEKNMSDILPLMLMSGQGGMDMSNPMSMYLMAKMLGDGKDSNDDSFMMAMMLSGAFNATSKGKTE